MTHLPLSPGCTNTGTQQALTDVGMHTHTHTHFVSESRGILPITLNPWQTWVVCACHYIPAGCSTNKKNNGNYNQPNAIRYLGAVNLTQNSTLNLNENNQFHRGTKKSSRHVYNVFNIEI